MQTYRNVQILTNNDSRAAIAATIFSRCLRERGPVEVGSEGPAIEFQLVDDVPGEAFEIVDTAEGVQVRAGGKLGLIHGAGKLLRDCVLGADGLTLGTWRGRSTPKLAVRGMYFATHFHNWYHVAPVDEIQRYVEELALWGINTLCVWYDMHHFNGIQDPAAQEMLKRLTAILAAARRIGMKTAAIFLANEAYANSPVELRADWTCGHDGYFREPGGHYNVEVCPSKPGGLDLLMTWAEERLRVYQNVGLDYLVIWPYDQGGCTCSQCTPWGANGYLRCAEPLARLFKSYFPEGKVILSTWYFDHFIHGEWQGLAERFATRPDWVDYLMADDYGDLFPPFLRANGAPGGFPVVGFPEISMYRCLPWGGYGANPLAAHYQAMWDQCKDLVAGGFPYSEGIFEDINKALFAGLYWDPDRPAAETLREYLHYEYGADAVKPLSEAITVLENNLPRKYENGRVETERLDGAETAWNLVQQVDAGMNIERRNLWRWRMLYRRAQIDAELLHTDGRLEGRTLREAFDEITRISHAGDALEIWVRPPVISGDKT